MFKIAYRLGQNDRWALQTDRVEHQRLLRGDEAERAQLRREAHLFKQLNDWVAKISRDDRLRRNANRSHLVVTVLDYGDSLAKGVLEASVNCNIHTLQYHKLFVSTKYKFRVYKNKYCLWFAITIIFNYKTVTK